jgi:hypothetical protein
MDFQDSMSALTIYRIPEVLDQPGTAVITRELQLSLAEFFRVGHFEGFC